MSSPLSLLDAKSQMTPTEFAAFLREKGPVYWWPNGEFWVVTDYALAETVLKNPVFSADRRAFFVSRMPNLDLSLIGDFFGVVTKMMVMSDGASHLQRRKLAAVGVTDELMDQFRPTVEATVGKLIQKISVKRQFDFVSELAVPLPSTVLADLFCIEESERENFYRWSNEMTQFFGGASQYRNEDGIHVNRSASQIRDYFRELIQKRRKDPKRDFLTILLNNQTGLGLHDDELISQAVMMLVAGQITTTDQMCNNVFTLLTEAGAVEAVRAMPGLLPTALEELNRLDPAVTFIFRVVSEDTLLGNHVIRAGDVVFVSNHAVNRDPRVFEWPDSCRFDRPKNPHFAYGHGPHFCLGAKLARIQMTALFGALLLEFPCLSLEPNYPPRRKHHSLSFSGFASLMLRP
jgi:cytochrome P450